MVFCESMKKNACSTLFLVLVSGFGCACSAAVQNAPVSPQSLAGDWEYSVTPQLKLVLHLHVDASGALSGTIDTPDTPPKHIELTDVHLAGNMLSYSMPPQPGTVREVISGDGKKMLGSYIWVKAGATETAPPFVPRAQIAGDWVTPGAGPSTQVLRIRLDAGGALIGTIDMPEPMTQRLPLSNVQVSGRTLSYTMPDGAHTYQGAFSSDGKTVMPTGQSTIDATWQHVRTAAQALAQEAADASKPTNGDWTGVANFTTNFPGVGLKNGTVTLAFHFKSNPASCSVEMKGSSNDAVPCTMTLTGNTVRMDRVPGYGATFNGTLSADGRHLSGTWTMGNNFHWTGPVQIDLTRSAQPGH